MSILIVVAWFIVRLVKVTGQSCEAGIVMSCDDTCDLGLEDPIVRTLWFTGDDLDFGCLVTTSVEVRSVNIQEDVQFIKRSIHSIHRVQKQTHAKLDIQCFY